MTATFRVFVRPFLALMLFPVLSGCQKPEAGKGHQPKEPLSMRSLLPELKDIPGDPPSSARRYALLVGVAKYDDDRIFPTLDFTENDAHDMGSLLRDQGYIVTILTRRAASEKHDDGLLPTAKNIRLKLEQMRNASREGDTVIAYFSGHGAHMIKRNSSVFCPQDADFKKPDDTLVSLNEVYESLKKCRASIRLLISDACRTLHDDRQDHAGFHSGTSTEERVVSLRNVSLPEPPEGIVALFASSKGEASSEFAVLGHGVFTYHLINGFEKAKNKQGEVELKALIAYVENEVPTSPELVKRGRHQTPYSRLNVSGKIVLASPFEVPIDPFAGWPGLERPRPQIWNPPAAEPPLELPPPAGVPGLPGELPGMDNAPALPGELPGGAVNTPLPAVLGGDNFAAFPNPAKVVPLAGSSWDYDMQLHLYFLPNNYRGNSYYYADGGPAGFSAWHRPTLRLHWFSSNGDRLR